MLGAIFVPASAATSPDESLKAEPSAQYDVLPFYGTPIEHEDISFNTSLNNAAGTKKLFGDTNSDGSVLAADILHLMQSLAGADVSINTTFSDVNFDGTVDMLDLVTLQRHIAGWESYKKLPYGKEVYVSDEDYLPDILYYEPAESEGGYYYNQLTATQKKYYNSLVTAIEAKNSNIIYSDLSSSREVLMCYFAVRWDHPEYFYVGQQYGYTTSMPYGMRLTYSFTENEIDRMNGDIKNSLQDLVDYVGDTDYTDYELELMVHDYLINQLDYDYSAASSGDTTVYPYAWNVYGGLVSDLCVCEGYAEAFMLCLKMFGINTGVATGSVHMWNFIELDGEYYYVDPTWDDTGDDVYYRYFNITYAEAESAHPFYPDYSEAADNSVFSGTFNLNAPIATATKYNYYIYESVPIYSTDTALKVMTDTFKEKSEEAFKSGQTEVEVMFYFDPASNISASSQGNNIGNAIYLANLETVGYSFSATSYYLELNNTIIVVPITITAK